MNPYFYKIKPSRIIDGDTLWAFFDLGFRASLEVNLRMMYYDSPETWRPKSELERQMGQKCTDFLTQLLAHHEGNVYAQSTNIDLYGRADAILYYKDTSGNYVQINDIVWKFMVENKLTKEDLAKALASK